MFIMVAVFFFSVTPLHFIGRNCPHNVSIFRYSNIFQNRLQQVSLYKNVDVYLHLQDGGGFRSEILNISDLLHNLTLM